MSGRLKLIGLAERCDADRRSVCWFLGRSSKRADCGAGKRRIPDSICVARGVGLAGLEGARVPSAPSK